MKKYLFGLLGCMSFLLCNNTEAQPVNDTITTAHWNLYNWRTSADNPNNPNRVANVRRAVKFINPDIFTVNEQNGFAAIQLLTNSVLNTQGETNYANAPFQSGGGSLHNGLFYRSDKFALLAQGLINSNPRAVNWYRMLYLPSVSGVRRDSVILTYFVVHAAASNGIQEEASRAATAGDILRNIGLTPSNIYRNRILQGDLNVYSSNAASYVAYTNASSTVNFRDVISNPFGTRIQYTQSPRNGQFDGGVGGGLDNRFDFILFQPQIVTDGADRVRYVLDSYKAIGNDGTNFDNADLNSRPNLIYPDSVVNGIYFGSDHLPVVAKLALNMRCFEATIASRNDSLIAQPANLREYFWYRGGELIATTPTNSYRPTVNGRFGYTVKIRNAAGCFDSSRAIFVTNSESIQQTEVSVFPNPASDVVKISSTANVLINTIQITDVAGRLVDNKTVNATELSINTSAMAKGLYFLKVNTQKGSLTKRLVIE